MVEGEVVHSANPTLNEKGGLYNIVENAMSSIAKFRKSPVVGVL